MKSRHTVIVLAMGLGAAPAVAQTPVPAPASVSQKNWWSLERALAQMETPPSSAPPSAETESRPDQKGIN